MGRVPNIESKIDICRDLLFTNCFNMKDIFIVIHVKILSPHYFSYIFAMNGTKRVVEVLSRGRVRRVLAHKCPNI